MSYIGRPAESQVAARGSITAKWLVAPKITLAEEGAVYLDSLHATARSTTALDTPLIGALKARLSYNVQFERDAPASHRQFDTVTRLSLAYGF